GSALAGALEQCEELRTVLLTVCPDVGGLHAPTLTFDDPGVNTAVVSETRRHRRARAPPRRRRALPPRRRPRRAPRPRASRRSTAHRRRRRATPPGHAPGPSGACSCAG